MDAWSLDGEESVDGRCSIDEHVLILHFLVFSCVNLRSDEPCANSALTGRLF
jgi:hypothetical protein